MDPQPWTAGDPWEGLYRGAHTQFGHDSGREIRREILGERLGLM